MSSSKTSDPPPAEGIQAELEKVGLQLSRQIARRGTEIALPPSP